MVISSRKTSKVLGWPAIPLLLRADKITAQIMHVSRFTQKIVLIHAQANIDKLKSLIVSKWTFRKSELD